MQSELTCWFASILSALADNHPFLRERGFSKTTAVANDSHSQRHLSSESARPLMRNTLRVLSTVHCIWLAISFVATFAVFAPTAWLLSLPLVELYAEYGAHPGYRLNYAVTEKRRLFNEEIERLDAILFVRLLLLAALCPLVWMLRRHTLSVARYVSCASGKDSAIAGSPTFVIVALLGRNYPLASKTFAVAASLLALSFLLDNPQHGVIVWNIAIAFVCADFSGQVFLTAGRSILRRRESVLAIRRQAAETEKRELAAKQQELAAQEVEKQNQLAREKEQRLREWEAGAADREVRYYEAKDDVIQLFLKEHDLLSKDLTIGEIIDSFEKRRFTVHQDWDRFRRFVHGWRCRIVNEAVRNHLVRTYDQHAAMISDVFPRDSFMSLVADAMRDPWQPELTDRRVAKLIQMLFTFIADREPAFERRRVENYEQAFGGEGYTASDSTPFHEDQPFINWQSAAS